LGPRSRRESGRELAPFGFLITAPDLVAANLAQAAAKPLGEEGVSFLTERKGKQLDVWFYSPADTHAAFLVPGSAVGPIKLTFDGGTEVLTKGAEDYHLVQLPSRTGSSAPAPKVAGPAKYLWHATTKIE
jgi:hypothetical protein